MSNFNLNWVKCPETAERKTVFLLTSCPDSDHETDGWSSVRWKDVRLSAAFLWRRSWQVWRSDGLILPAGAHSDDPVNTSWTVKDLHDLLLPLKPQSENVIITSGWLRCMERPHFFKNEGKYLKNIFNSLNFFEVGCFIFSDSLL